MRPAKMPYIEETAAEPGSVEVTPSMAPIFQSFKLPAIRRKKFANFLKFVDENPNLIANDQNEMILEGKRLAVSNFEHLIRNFYVAEADYNLTGISHLPHAHSKAKRSPSAISNTKFKSLLSPAKSPQFHSPMRSAPSSPTSTETINPLVPAKRLKHGRPQAAPPHQIGLIQTRQDGSKQRE